jgi:hypothetical protein
MEIGQEFHTCILFRHRKFVRDGKCIVCNPEHYDHYQHQISAEGLKEYYAALVAGTHCHWLKCEKPGANNDGLGHWWCQEHKYHCLFLQEGAMRGFPCWEYLRGHSVLEGRPSWYKSAIHATSEDMLYRVAALRGVIAETLRTQYEEPVEGGVGFEGDVYAVLPQEIRDMMALGGEVGEEEVDLSAIPF